MHEVLNGRTDERFGWTLGRKSSISQRALSWLGASSTPPSPRILGVLESLVLLDLSLPYFHAGKPNLTSFLEPLPLGHP